MTLQCCRLCAEDVTNSHHKVAIYGTNSQGLAVRITALLEIPISISIVPSVKVEWRGWNGQCRTWNHLGGRSLHRQVTNAKE